MFDSQIIAFTLVAAALTLTPGADTMLVVRNVLRGGRGDGISTTLGISLGLFVHATLSALGLSVIVMHSATAYGLVKLAGAAYLLWLGIQSLAGAGKAAPLANVEAGLPPVPGSRPLRRCFVEGFLNNVLNPKVAIFYLAFLPQFIAPADPLLAKSILLAGIHFIQGLVWLTTVSVAVDQGRKFFLHSSIRRWLDRICGIILIGLGLRLALERR
jgi:RhtB (resistance to homoserine/threonine) family protein